MKKVILWNVWKPQKGLASPLCTPLGGMIYEVLFKTGA